MASRALANAAQADVSELFLTAGADLPEQPEPAVRTVFASLEGFIGGDEVMRLVCLAKQFCVELGVRGHDPQATWEELLTLDDPMLAHLNTADGWATLSAYATGGKTVLRLRGEQ